LNFGLQIGRDQESSSQKMFYWATCV
jgi:hypothetical protein